MAQRERSRTEPPGEPVPAQERREYVHTLSLRLTAQQYRRLRRFVTAYEDRTGHRLTHQAVLEAALKEYIEKQQKA